MAASNTRRIAITAAAAVIVAAAVSIWSHVHRPPQLYEKTRTAMGTFVTVGVYAPNASSADASIDEAFGVISRLEAVISRFNPESEVSRLNAAPTGTPISVSSDLANCLKRSLDVAQRTQGAFDPTVGPLVALWKAAGKSGLLPTTEEIDAARQRASYRNVVLNDGKVTLARPGVLLDLSSVGKSYIVHQAAQVLRERGVTSGYVNGGGDIAFIGSNADGRPWRVGIADPRDESECVAALYVSDRGVITSGNYNQYVTIGGKRYSHIIDARTGRPAEGPASVTVVARTTEDGAGWSTALSVMGRDGWQAADSAGIDYLMIFVEGGELVRVESPGIAQYMKEAR
jgi:FAD:protein FMN transferase